ncbi:hypothetical protein [Spiroplasma endosymbiont of Villa modesta]|uniref:hypothetical protein n=1 Tax=Spiroplasma endosymbiont of Villa modesta TaxID=3066293 RepID=UPI00313F128A
MTRCITCKSLTENTTGICDSPYHNSFNKAKFITYLENKIENDGYRSANVDAIYYSLIKKIDNGEFE